MNFGRAIGIRRGRAENQRTSIYQVPAGIRYEVFALGSWMAKKM
jgi:hypothetical protein